MNVWLDDNSKMGHLQEWKIAQLNYKFAKVGSNHYHQKGKVKQASSFNKKKKYFSRNDLS